MIHEMKALFKTTGSGVKFLLLLILRCPFDAAMTVINAVFLQNAFNAIIQGDSAKLEHTCLVFGVATICLFLYNFTVWSIYAPFTTKIEGKLRAKLFLKILSFSYEKIENTPQGDFITRLNTDVQMPFSRPLHFPHAVCAITNITVSAVILWFMSPMVFYMVLLFVVPHVLLSQLMVARKMPRLNKKSLEVTAKNTGDLTVLITCADTAAIYNAKEFLFERFKKSSLELLRANMKIKTKNALSDAIIPLFGMGGYLTLLIISGTFVANGSLSFGDLTAAFQYRAGLLKGAMMFIASMISIKASMASIKRINETMSERTENLDG